MKQQQYWNLQEEKEDCKLIKFILKYLSSIYPGLGRSPGEGKGYSFQYSGLENSMDSTVHGVTKSRTRLSDFHFSLSPAGEDR